MWTTRERTFANAHPWTATGLLGSSPKHAWPMPSARRTNASRRVPNSASDLALCILHVQLRRPWCLYVYEHPNPSCRRLPFSAFKPCVTNDWPVYLFLGCVVLGNRWWQYVPGSLVALIGVVYIGLEFVPSIEPPANMRYVEPVRTSHLVGTIILT